jgi:hypothetical protein
LRVLAVGIEHALDVAVQRPHDADPREHHRAPDVATRIKASIAAGHSGAVRSTFGDVGA